MKAFFRTFVLLSLIVSLVSCGAGQNEPVVLPTVQAPVAVPSLIPLPGRVEWKQANFTVPQNNIICANAEGMKGAQWLKKLLEASGKAASIETSENCGTWKIEVKNTLFDTLGDEGYKLDISEEGVHIQSASEAGAFYAVQTLRQMFPAAIETGNFSEENIVLRQVSLQDKPEYEWRGTMVDVARSFFGMDYLKKHIDRMALYKLNRLHLHLTDDQGWRIEIKKWPKLTEVSGKSSVRRGRAGFLTQDDYKELQDYASARNVVIVPEVDMPGHIYAALVAYPELNCDDYSNLTPKRATPPDFFEDYNVGWTKFCLEKPEIYDFVTDVIGELSAITDGEYIHIGGDEIDDERYEEFVAKADSIVRSFGKTTIGWEEGSKAEVSQDFISQQWTGKVKSAVPNLKVIHSLCSQFYFDHANITGQENTNNWCKETGVSLEDAYSFEEENPNTIGIEAPVWSEFVLTDEMMDNRFWPRAIALAEIAWTSKENRDFDSFKERLGKQGKRLKALDVNFHRSEEIDWGEEEKTPGVFSNFNLNK